MTKLTKIDPNDYRSLYRSKSFYVDWVCKDCKYVNFEIRGHCKKCHMRRHYTDMQLVKGRKSRERDRHVKPFFRQNKAVKRVKRRNAKVTKYKWKKVRPVTTKKPKKLFTSVTTWYCGICNQKCINILKKVTKPHICKSCSSKSDEQMKMFKMFIPKSPDYTPMSPSLLELWNSVSGVDITENKATTKQSTIVPDDPRDDSIYEESNILILDDDEIANIKLQINEAQDMKCVNKPGIY